MFKGYIQEDSVQSTPEEDVQSAQMWQPAHLPLKCFVHSTLECLVHSSLQYCPQTLLVHTPLVISSIKHVSQTLLVHTPLVISSIKHVSQTLRSEERRVGKEC